MTSSKKRLLASTSPDLSAPMPADADSPHPLATEPARFGLYLRERSLAKVARAAGVTPQVIAKQADRHEWRERALEHDRKRGLSRSASASAKTLAHLERIDDAISAETASWDDETDAQSVMERAGGTVQVVDKLQKARREALADLPAEPEPELDLSVLTEVQLGLLRAAEELQDALKVGKPGAPIEPKPGALRAFCALVESDVGRSFLLAYGRANGLNGLPLTSSDLGIAPERV